MAVVREVKWTCEACPVQGEGVFEDGRLFYFRARWDSIYLGVTSIDDLEKAVLPETADDYEVKDHEGAGWLSDTERDAILSELASQL